MIPYHFKKCGLRSNNWYILKYEPSGSTILMGFSNKSETVIKLDISIQCHPSKSNLCSMENPITQKPFQYIDDQNE